MKARLISSENGQDLLWISFGEGLSQGYDMDYDVRKMKGDNRAPQLFTVEGDEHFTIDAMSPLVTNETRTVQLNFKAGINGSFTLKADELYKLEHTDVILEDQKLNVLQVLNTNPVYTFHAVTYQSPQRFLIHFNRFPDGINEDYLQDEIYIYSFNNHIYVKSTGDATGQKKKLTVYNMTGQKTMEKTLLPAKLSEVSLIIPNSYVVVKVQTKKSVYTNKIFIKN